ncbi:DUF6404 family protein [Photobacterium obscurum]|uniref:DUF6404 family protein n=1 Tax=Photobacterium obscurum TaxID=2829490 RepID=UPI00389A499A
MYFNERLTLAHCELKQHSLRESNYNPIYLRGLRCVGFKVRPSHYNSIGINLIIGCLGFAVPWCIMMVIICWFPFDTDATVALQSSLFMIATYSWYIAL